MTTRFQGKNVPGGRLTPSTLSATASTATTNSTLTLASPSTYMPGQTDQVYLGKK